VLGELPDEMKSQVIEFVNGNRETLLAYWNGELSTREMLDALKPR
jgi:hypothetical protein